MILSRATIVALALVWRSMATGQTNELPVIVRTIDSVGDGFRNRFTRSTNDVATARLRGLRYLNRDVSIAEFLGPEVERCEVVAFRNPIRNAEEAISGFRKLLRAPIVGPSAAEMPTSRGAMWSEWTTTTLKALVYFKGGAIGRIHCDLRRDANAVHVFLEDSEGIFWWTRVHVQLSGTADDADIPKIPKDEGVRSGNDAGKRE